MDTRLVPASKVNNNILQEIWSFQILISCKIFYSLDSPLMLGGAAQIIFCSPLVADIYFENCSNCQKPLA